MDFIRCDRHLSKPQCRSFFLSVAVKSVGRSVVLLLKESQFTQPLNKKKANSRNLSLIRLVTLASLFWRLVLMVLPSLQTATYSLTCSSYLLLTTCYSYYRYYRLQLFLLLKLFSPRLLLLLVLLSLRLLLLLVLFSILGLLFLRALLTLVFLLELLSLLQLHLLLVLFSLLGLLFL